MTILNEANFIHDKIQDEPTEEQVYWLLMLEPEVECRH